MKIAIYSTDSYSGHDEFDSRYVFKHVIKDIHKKRQYNIFKQYSLNVRRWTVQNHYKKTVVKGAHIACVYGLLLSSLRRIYYYNHPLQWWYTCNCIYSGLQKIKTFECWSDYGIWISHYYRVRASKHQIW